MKKIGSKLLYLVAGIVLIVFGGYLTYSEIVSHNGSSYHHKWHKYPFIILGVGIVVAAMAFVNEEKPTKTDQKTAP